MWLVYSVRKSHLAVAHIDKALSSGNVEEVVHTLGFSDLSLVFSEDGSDNAVFVKDHSVPGLGSIEHHLLISNADLIAEVQARWKDDPEFPCCSCERLHQRKQVSSVNFTHDKYHTDIWMQLRAYLDEHTLDQNYLYVCKYCRPLLNGNKMPARCILNGLLTEAVPEELKQLNALSRQLVQRAKAFQTIVRLGTYTGNVPKYISLQACKGSIFFLPLPLNKTMETLGEVGITTIVPIPDPELYIMVNGIPTKGKVVWRSLVDINLVKAAFVKLKEINWLYKNVDDKSLEDTTKKVVETIDTTSSTMIEKATKEDIAMFQSYTIRSLDQQHSITADIDQYKMLNVKEIPLNSRQEYLDVMCFPNLFPSGHFGELHTREVHISSSEYAKSRLLNKDSRFRKDAQYVFFLLSQQQMCQIASGIYNLLKCTAITSLPVHAFLSSLSKSDKAVEANLSTIFQTVRGTKQFWFLRSSELKCMVREWGTPTLFLTFSCAEYDCEDIARYLRKVNDQPSTYPISKLCVEDAISVSRVYSLKFHAFLNLVILKAAILGVITHHFYKKEYQSRGAPHYHILLWIEGAPVIGESDPVSVLKWIQERITCKIPNAALNPELHKLVTKYQMHKCSPYCKRKRNLKGTFVTTCKSGFPRDSTECASLYPVEECLKSKKKIPQLPRLPQEACINDYNPLLLLLWKANMDIQYIAESSLTLAHYVTGYVTKAEKSNMQDVMQKVSANTSIYSKLWSFGIRCLRSREVGLYEASDLLLGDHLTDVA